MPKKTATRAITIFILETTESNIAVYYDDYYILDDVLLVPQQQAPPQSSGADARTDINGHQMHDIANVDTKI